MVTGIAIRAARPADAAAIRVLLTDAFGGPAEGSLVEALRAAGDMVLEKVAVAGEEIVGHVGYARLAVEPVSPVSSPAERSEGKGTQASPRSSTSPASGRRPMGDPVDPPIKSGDDHIAERGTGSPSLATSSLAGDDTEKAACIVALAPLSVAAAWRRRGIGAALVRAPLEELKTAGCDLVLVLGDPAYYRRFGFVPAAEFSLRTPYDGPHQQALALTERGRTARDLRVTYPESFAGLE